MSKLHESLSSQHTVKTASDFSFGITFAVFFSLISLLGFIKSSPWVAITTSCALAFLIITFIRPKLFSVPNKIWTTLGLAINKITQPIIMFLLFFIFLTPFAFLYRLFGKKGLHLNFDSGAKSYWIKKEPYDTLKKSMKNQF